MALNLSGLHTGRYHRLYVLKDGEYIDVSTLGSGGGGDTTELETRISTVETALPQKAETSTVSDLSGIVALKAEQLDLSALASSAVNNSANSVLANASNVLQDLQTQLPLRMITDSTTNSVQLLIGDVSQLASPATLGLTTLTDDSGLEVSPARVKTGRVALDSTSNSLQVQIAPDDATSPTWAHTKMAVTDAGVGIGIGYPQGGAKLHVLGDVRIDGGISASHPALAPWSYVTAQSNLAFTTQQPHQQYILVLNRNAPYSDNLLAEGIRADGSVSPPLHWRVEQGTFAHSPIDFSGAALLAYASGPTLQAGNTGPLTVRWGLTKGTEAHFFCTTLHRHDNTPGLTDMLCHGIYTHADIVSVRFRFVNNGSFDAQYKATI